MDKSTTKRKKNTGKSKFQSVDIIRDNQPLKFRQNSDKNDEKSNPQIQDDEADWEEGCIPSSSCPNNNNVNSVNQNNGVTIEFDALPESPKKKRIRRATAEDKEFAELVHKVHLLCLIARGRLIDAACDDPLIQASLLSLLPPHLLKLSEVAKLTANALTPLVSWFHQNFKVKSPSSAEKPFQSALAYALEAQGGSPEEVAALSVSLFRALNLTTRFVSVLDVTSLKPEVDENEQSYNASSRERKDIFNSSTLMVSKMSTGTSSTKSSASHGNIHITSVTSVSEAKNGRLPTNIEVKDSLASNQLIKSDLPINETQNASEEDKCPRKKGDLEFEMQLQMAMSATALVAPERKPEASTSGSPTSPLASLSPFKRIKRITEESPSSSHAISTAIGSRKVGAPLHWAEVYCSGENMTGKWVHIDAVNSIVDGELKVEAAVTACKKSLSYVVAFAGHGAKDVTRRYCEKWYKISPKRIYLEWWDAVLAPLKQLESRATGGMVPVHHKDMKSTDLVDSRSSLEDMELATRALTEPLPTSQQAYRTHPLYAIEKWLTKYQILHPRGPVLGFCSGHAVYPRTCVQVLRTKERWLREGLQVKESELPAKVVKSSSKNRRGQTIEVEDLCEGGSDEVVSLFGKWQTEPLCLPPAVNGIVPKNERGQVDVWSEKCLPPGTVHLRFPRLVPVVKRLGINFAPAMVGFEFRNGRSIPVYEGIVVCTEFRETVLEAYAEEEQRREEEERKREERQALSRWYQLLSSMVVRQRLNNTYLSNVESKTVTEPLKTRNKSSCAASANVNESTVPHRDNVRGAKIHDSDKMHLQNHEHVFLTDDESFDEDSMTRTKRCSCGVSVQVEEL
ncbi:DNA repair protein RAD4-like [Chenopodium quinoa]|uniref:DNA repair protein RAD4-like n=1 Tax=Chenopodium quinoa TaxID=63459 RepID=UPI000B77BD95|nr:DNA repair protein RAD4-like [Chenopodium quinoa]